MTDTDLLPCPFCGERAFFGYNKEENFDYIECSGADCHASITRRRGHAPGPQTENLTARWNRRTLTTALRASLAQTKMMHEALVDCESTLQLCSERIASDRVALDQIVNAFAKNSKPSPQIEAAQKHQNEIDGYAFKAIDAARNSARAALETQP